LADLWRPSQFSVKRTAPNQSNFISDVTSVFGVDHITLFPTKGLSCSFYCLLDQAKHALEGLARSFTLPSLQQPLEKLTLPIPFKSITSGATFTVKRSSDIQRVLQNVNKEQHRLMDSGILGISYEQSEERQLSTELDETLNTLSQLKTGWTGEIDSEPPSAKTLELIRAIFSKLPEEFDFPEVGALDDGSVEFVWRDYHLYGSLNDEFLEFERVCRPTHEKHEFKNTGNVQEMLIHLRDCLQNAIDCTNSPDDDE
jgi:hypothetical protein